MNSGIPGCRSRAVQAEGNAAATRDVCACRRSSSAVALRACLRVASPWRWRPGARHPPSKDAAAPTAADPLGRSTPRGTVVGFLNAARRGENVVARQYLNTTANAEQADLLARQLFVVLDVRLPARLAAISDVPEGSRRNPLVPNQELIATISTAQGALDISVERVERGSGTPVWLFSRVTLAAVPAVYDELQQLSEATALQRCAETRPVLEQPPVRLGRRAAGDSRLLLRDGAAQSAS